MSAGTVTLGAGDAIGARPRRIAVAGASGAGKTTLARQISNVLGITHTEIDALFHGPGWTARPTFDAEVAALAASPAWVTEWQYASARPMLAAHADLLVWLDLPRLLVTGRVVRRTLVRRTRRQVLWNGNVEPPLHTFLTDPDHIVRWSWRSHRTVRARVASVRVARPSLRVVRLRSSREVGQWIAGPLRTVAAR